MTAKDQWVQPTTAQIVDALMRARALIANGWIQNRAYELVDGTDCYCPNGAIAEVCGTIRLSWPVEWYSDDAIPGQVVLGAWLRDRVAAALQAALPRPYDTLAGFNDAAHRTREDVLLLFQVAIQETTRKAAAA